MTPNQTIEINYQITNNNDQALKGQIINYSMII